MMGAHQSAKESPKYPVCNTNAFSPDSIRFAATYKRDESEKKKNNLVTNLIPSKGATTADEKRLCIRSKQDFSINELLQFERSPSILGRC